MTDERFRDVIRREREFLLSWLACLPRQGWEGTAVGLAAELDRVCLAGPWRHSVSVPLRRVGEWLRSHADVLAAAGWQVTERRTSAERLITIAKKP